MLLLQHLEQHGVAANVRRNGSRRADKISQDAIDARRPGFPLRFAERIGAAAASSHMDNNKVTNTRVVQDASSRPLPTAMSPSPISQKMTLMAYATSFKRPRDTARLTLCHC